jgi:hypothetical protein
MIGMVCPPNVSIGAFIAASRIAAARLSIGALLQAGAD